MDILLWFKNPSDPWKKWIGIDLAYLIFSQKRTEMEKRIVEIVDEMGEV